MTVSVLAFFPLKLSGQGNCNCSNGLNITSDASIKSLMISGQLPFFGSNIGCISVADGVTLNFNASYSFTGTNFKMGANSKIIVNAPFRLTLQSNCKLEGCNGMWGGITLDPTGDQINPGGQLDMSNSRIEDAVTGVYARNFAQVRFVSNVFADNNYGLKVTGFVPFINLGDPNDFKNNTFSASWPNASTAILFDNAVHFSIGQDLSNPPAVINTITGPYRGIDIKNSSGIGIYGVKFYDMYESGAANNSEPYFSSGLCIGAYQSRNIYVKYCSMIGWPSIPAFQQPNFGIATLFGQGKQIFHDNFIRSNVLGIAATSLPFSGTTLDIQNDSIISRNCVRVKLMSDGIRKNMLVKNNRLTYSPYYSFVQSAGYDIGGILTEGIGAPYQIYDNTTRYAETATIPIYGAGIELGDNTGISEVSDNNMIFSGQYAGVGLNIYARNSRIYRNTVTGALTGNFPYRNTGIYTVGSTNLAFCCNTVNGSDLGTHFSGSNADVKFYTTTYGAHDTALYFPPAAMLDPQLNTGNNWAGASTLLDAFYNGSLQQAQSNAPFQTALANINASKIVPNGWFFLTGTDPSCTQPAFSCPDITPVSEFIELTGTDLSALSAVNEGNEYVLRFQQKRQLFRKLAENPSLTTWNQAVSDFYAAAQNNTVGAFDALDEAFYRLHSLSPSLEQTYTPLAEQLDSLSDELNAVRAQYPSATPAQQEILLEEAYDLAGQIAVLQDSVNALLPAVENGIQTRLNQLLAQNAAIVATEVWEINEKNINDLYFRHAGGLLDTFTATQKSFIETLALSCPQYEGVGVYKARRLYELFATSVPAYHEHDCKPLEERSYTSQTPGTISLAPNPAGEQMWIYFGQTLPSGSKIVFSGVHGKVLFTKAVDEMSETVLDITAIQAGVYILTVHIPDLAPLTIKAVISH